MSEPTSSLIDQARGRVLAAYGGVIGQSVDQVVTPALILDLPTAIRNISLMADQMRGLPSDLRPHIKVHKSPDLARLQIEHGAIGLSLATVWEAATMALAGIDDLFVVNTVTGQPQINVLAGLAREHRILVAVDDVGNAESLAAAARDSGSTLGVLVEVDTGMDRAGVDSEAEAIKLAQRVTELPGLQLEGLTGYEGHCSLTPDPDQRAKKHRDAMEFFVGVADRLTEDGLSVEVRSAGGTATWDWTAAYPGITEIQAGSYVVMDNFHGHMVPEFEIALTVAATVISRRVDRVILDAGNKSVGAPDLATIKGSTVEVVRFDEEHGIFGNGSDAPRLGDRVEVVPGYSPTTVNMYDAYHVVDDGIVVDIWPVVPRGPGHHGLWQHSRGRSS